jgi:hypothetical protein
MEGDTMTDPTMAAAWEAGRKYGEATALNRAVPNLVRPGTTPYGEAGERAPATEQEIRMAAWHEGYWARGHDEEYDTNTDCPFGPFEREAFLRASYSRDEVDLIASVEDWATRVNTESLREAQRQQYAAARSAESRAVNPHSRHPHANDGECIHGYDKARYITQDYYSGEPL